MHQLCAFAEENREGERGRERERERRPEAAPVLQCYVAYHASRRLGGSSTLGKGPKKNSKKKIVRSQRRNVGEEERERERERPPEAAAEDDFGKGQRSGWDGGRLFPETSEIFCVLVFP